MNTFDAWGIAAAVLYSTGHWIGGTVCAALAALAWAESRFL